MSAQTVGIAGLGLLGRGIAACLLSRGFDVIAHERDSDARAQARRHISHAIDDLVRRGGFAASLIEQWPKRFLEAKSVAELAPCEFVIESIPEDLDAKSKLFGEIESVVGPAIPIASNTSALPISILQRGRVHPERFIGVHWAEPCHLTRFLEIIRGAQTNDATADAAVQFARGAGKDPTLVNRDVEGFIANRLGYAMYREAFWLLENGVADVETIDRAYRNAASVWVNIAGPFRWMDLTGVPAYAAVMKRLFPQLSNATEVPAAIRAVVERGGKGISNGQGFYTYTPEESRRWERLLIENVWRVRQMQDELEKGNE